MTRTTIDELLAAARSRLQRVDPPAAAVAIDAGATLIDIRSDSQITQDGVVPGALLIPRDGQVIVMCNEGYQSSLAAATLQELGFTRATDLDGGFQAWRSAGFPVTCV